MARYQSIVAYDGTAYHGFQRQAEGLPTIQAKLEQALGRIGWQGESLLAAGRTDAGVHALGQVIAFDHQWEHPTSALTAALNDQLPVDIGVVGSSQVAEDFHPRFDASSRVYRYRLLLSPQPDPLRVRFIWRRWAELDLAAMQRAADGLLGRHDFGAFGQAPVDGGHTRRHIFKADWVAAGDEWHFIIEANAFLQHMVRRLVAALIQVGENRVGVQELLAHLDQNRRRWQGNLAPPAGLTLLEVRYEPTEQLSNYQWEG